MTKKLSDEELRGAPYGQTAEEILDLQSTVAELATVLKRSV